MEADDKAILPINFTAERYRRRTARNRFDYNDSKKTAEALALINELQQAVYAYKTAEAPTGPTVSSDEIATIEALEYIRRTIYGNPDLTRRLITSDLLDYGCDTFTAAALGARAYAIITRNPTASLEEIDARIDVAISLRLDAIGWQPSAVQSTDNVTAFRIKS